MSFTPETAPRVIPAEGPKNAKIAIVGEAGGSYENTQLRPFVGPAGGVLEHCMHAAGIIRSEVYITNVVKLQPKGNEIAPYFNGAKGQFTFEGKQWVDALLEELQGVKPNVVGVCGATALCALTGKTKITKYRGYVLEGVNQLKVIPLIHPAAALRGQYVWRYLIATDLKKIKAESGFPEIRRPQRQLVTEFSHVHEVLEWIEYFEKATRVCFDIEVLNYELACISFSDTASTACSIPLDHRWSESDEALIWRGLQRVLGNPASTKVGQNLIFDIHFLLTKCGIEVKGPLEDTMVAHSVMFPELNKGLGFLVSLYGGSQAYYKDMVKFSNIKEES